MKEWEKLVQRLADNIRPNHLTLYLIVNAEDAQTARSILKPLDQLPTLKNCGLWLNKDKIPELKTIAQETAKCLTSSVRTMKPFRYLELPIEIRWRILEYSDLVYDRAIGWKAPLPSLWKMPSPYCSCEHELDRDTIDSGMHLPDCSRDEMDAIDLQPYVADYKFGASHCCKKSSRFTRCNLTPAGFCECIFHCKHSAYSSSLLAQPRTGVHPLLLVSKQVSQDAVSVFFQRNRFFVIPPCNLFALWHPDQLKFDPERIVTPMPRLELSLFLSSLARNALRNIRYLEWILPQFKNYTTASKSAYLDYLDTVEMMAQAMVLPQLTLVLDLRGGIKIKDSIENNHFYWLTRVAPDGKVYDRVLHPLRRLEGLKDFFLYLRRVNKRFVPGGCAYDNDEMKYEKAVMGEE
ncbi:hypothetical protein DPSP01_007185 [Paraphaeosphaeria sporulosa]